MWTRWKASCSVAWASAGVRERKGSEQLNGGSAHRGDCGVGIGWGVCLSSENAKAAQVSADVEARFPEAAQQARGASPVGHSSAFQQPPGGHLGLLPAGSGYCAGVSAAARDWLFPTSRTRILLRCPTLWREESLGDGGGFVGHRRTRGVRIAAAAVPAHDAAGTGRGSARVSKREWRRMSCTASMLSTLALVEVSCCYCEQSSLIGYCSPLTRARTPP
ncbi:hypothetical protein LdCL_310016000 [Leishmania donovani]|uniref:Uncharacterized protein n=1 Tax=Leishmania donovani TaxID=5661 RepID=A0A3Q8ICG7_LEIDO|nr:hypothetical protein LdCL_310015600 [Leishmania donovani]AYU81287.1 hypothetical protein LdCL_310015800 [Leishmania donovani]AYU81289.1 hypothetical protein LdCL_310016000 [Leishmania donovani]